MLQKKVCMVGAFATGKTSLVARFVKGIYSDKYHTTIGVKIDKKQLITNDYTINMMLWDIHGEDEFQNVRMSYLRGAAAYLLVVDGTRRSSLDVALGLRDKVAQNIGDIPFIMAINKSDLQDQWEINAEDIARLRLDNVPVINTSAKDDIGVDICFHQLAEKMTQAS